MRKWGFDKLVIDTLEQPGCLPGVANELLLQTDIHFWHIRCKMHTKSENQT